MNAIQIRRVARLVPLCLFLLLLIAPLGGGGTSSAALLTLHTLIFVAVALSVTTKPHRERVPPALWSALAFALWCVLGTWLASYRFGSFTTTWDVLMALGLLWVAWRLGGSARVRRLLVLGTVTAALIVAGAALYGGMFHPGLRSAGTFLNPNRTAAFLNLALGLVIARLGGRRRGRGRWWVVAAALVGVQFWPVASRGGLVALVLVCGVFLVARAPSRRARWLAVGAAAVLALAAGAALAHRFAGPQDVYRYARLQMWSSSLHAVVEQPVTGVGPGMFDHVAERYNFPRTEGPVRFGRRFHSTHSQYLEVLVETGVPGLLLFLISAGLVFAGIFRWHGPLHGGPRRYPTGVLLGLGALAVHGVVEPVLLSPAVALTAATLAGSALAAWRPGTPSLQPRQIARRLLLPGAAVAAALYYVTTLSPFLADRHFTRLDSARSAASFRRELAGALRHNPFQPYYYDRACRMILDSLNRLDPASYSVCYDYAAKAVRLHGEDPWLHLLRARVSRRGFREVFGGQPGAEEALDHYRRAVAEAVTDPRPAAEMAGFLVGLGQDEAALAVVAHALEIEPNFLDAHRLKISALERLGRLAEAAEARIQLEASRAAIGDYRPGNDYETVILAWRQ